MTLVGNVKRWCHVEYVAQFKHIQTHRQPSSSMQLTPSSPLSNATNRMNTHSVFTAELQRHNNTVHENTDWTLTMPNSQILIIGDSNLSNITTSPNNHVNIESFPGAKIAHIRQLLTKLENQPSTEPECVILSIGINDRENNPSSLSPAKNKFI